MKKSKLSKSKEYAELFAQACKYLTDNKTNEAMTGQILSYIVRASNIGMEVGFNQGVKAGRKQTIYNVHKMMSGDFREE